MAKKERPVNVLFIDDKEDEMVEFKTLARQNRILIRTSHTSAESGLEELSSNVSRYDAVILDARAFRKKDQVSGTESIGSLRDCINGINAIERDTKRKIPYCVYTGYMESIDWDAWEDDIQVFIKGDQQADLFAYLKEEVKKIPESNIIREFSDVFELFDEGHLDLDYRDRLLFVLMNYESRQPRELEGAITQTRKILEGLYKRLHAMGRLPDDVVPRGRPNLEWCYRFVSGMPVNDLTVPGAIVPEHISWQLKAIKENSSAAGAHDYEESIHNFTLKTMVFALLDVLLWFKKFAKENS